MSNEPATTPQTPQAIAATTRSKPGKVTGKLSLALDLMVTEGKHFDEAARSVNLSVRAMRKGLDRPHVLLELRRRKHVFRAHASSANIRKLVDLRDGSPNQMTRLGAIRTLELLEDEGRSPLPSGHPRQPGVVIQILTQREPRLVDERMIEIDPQEQAEAVANE